jgi:hypothetical protein
MEVNSAILCLLTLLILLPATMAGGVFWVSTMLFEPNLTLNPFQRPTADDQGINSITTGYVLLVTQQFDVNRNYFILDCTFRKLLAILHFLCSSFASSTSALLAEITGDSKYTKAAILSAQWIKAHNINADGIILDSVNGHDCTRSPSNWLFTYNSGKFIEGLSVLASVTKDSLWIDL